MTSVDSSRKRKLDALSTELSLIKVALKGEPLSYTDLAAQKYFGNSPIPIEFLRFNSVQDVFDQVGRGDSSYGLLALESSAFGTIHTIYDRLLASKGNIQIVGEMGQIEQFCLCSKTGVNSDVDVDKIISHPHFLEGCSEYLKSLDARRLSLARPKVDRVASWDSAAACELVATQSDGLTSAAVCSREAAAKHGLKVLVEAIGNDRNAETRYIVIAKTVTGSANLSVIDPLAIAEPLASPSAKSTRFVPPIISSKAGRKQSIAIALRNIPGAIFKMSSCFAFRNIDIIKIESRPATVAMQLALSEPGDRPFTQRHWDLIFYIDFEPSEQSDVNDAMFRNLTEYCLWIRVLGSYRSGLNNATIEPSEWSSMVDTLAC